MTVKVTPKMTPKRQRMTLKEQRMTPRMVNMTPKTELLQMIYKRLTMTQKIPMTPKMIQKNKRIKLSVIEANF